MKIFFLSLLAASSLMAGCGQLKTRAELLQDVVTTQRALIAAQKNSRNEQVISNAQTAYDAAYLEYYPDFPQSYSVK
jgi:hypothetical protein